MAAGDLITADGQYEFQGLLLNSRIDSTHADPIFMVTKVDGLWAIDTKVNDFDNPTDDGSFVGVDYVDSKQIIMEFNILGGGATPGNDAHAQLDLVRRAWQPQTTLIPFVFQKPGITGKQVLYVRPRKLAVPSDFDLGKGNGSCVAELRAPDPRIYELAVQSVAIPVNGAADCIMGGWFNGGADPTIVLTGPFTNPRVTNNLTARTIRFDLALVAGKTLTIDVFNRTAVDSDGVDRYSTIRTDNQWWSLLPGVNNVGYAATGTSGASGCQVSWQNARI